MDKRLLDKLRADFKLVAAVFVGRGDWTVADERDAGAAIADLVEKDDLELLACWQMWLADLSHRLLGAMPVSPKTVAAPVPACRDCHHQAKPGKADGHCALRIDLAKAYGTNHPLHILPADGGASCALFAVKR